MKILALCRSRKQANAETAALIRENTEMRERLTIAIQALTQVLELASATGDRQEAE